MKQPPVMRLIRERAKLRLLLAAFPNSNAPQFSAAYRDYRFRSHPIRMRMLALDKQIGARPAWWTPRRKTADDVKIERQYATVG